MRPNLDPFDRPLDAMLERLRVHGLSYRWSDHDLSVWSATCPVCRERVTLRESHLGAPVTVICESGCHESRIVAALAEEPSFRDEGLDLAEAASAIAWRALELLEASCR